MNCSSIHHSYVIFGATGNLATRKLLPALFQLHCLGELAPDVTILGCGRTPHTRPEWREEVKKLLASGHGGHGRRVDGFLERLDYLPGSLRDAAFFEQLKQRLDRGCENNIVFYLSVSPELYTDVTEGLAGVGLLDEQAGWRRMVIEKPFGHDLESARMLQQRLDSYLREEQIYRIDHYVGKEAVQNLLVLRFANLTLEPLWNRHHIDHIQITHAETVGVDGRVAYYDRSGGAMRDMMQSHLLQVLALLAMEPPVSLEAESLRDEKVKVLRSIRPVDLDHLAGQAVRGQYAAGTVNGAAVPGYLQEHGVSPGSHTETYAALKLAIDNWRWKGVPFYLRTGKRLQERRSMIAVCFRRPPMQLFQDGFASGQHPNWLLIGIQPEDEVRLEITAKIPGLDLRTRKISMNASVGRPEERKAEAYEELLLDVIQGDRSLFLRYDEVLAAWDIIDPLLHQWSQDEQLPLQYPAGGWGPKSGDRLIAASGHAWRHEMQCEDGTC